MNHSHAISRASALLAVSALLLGLCGCSEVMLSPPTLPRPAVVQGGNQQTWSTYTDLDDVRGVAVNDDQVLVATDYGLLVHPRDGGSAPLRHKTLGGLQSADLRAVTALPGGSFAVASSREVFVVRDNVRPLPAPPLASIRALICTTSGVLYAGGDGGVATYSGDQWVRVGEPLPVLGFVAGPDNTIWARTTDGILVFSADGQASEHRNGVALPAGYVRDLLPLPEGRAFALLQNGSESMLAYYDGIRWYAYTIEGFRPEIVGLGMQPTEDGGQEIVMVTRDWRYGIREPRGRGEATLTPVSRSEPQRVVTYLAQGEVQALLPPPSEASEAELLAPAALVSLPPNHPEITAPAFAVSPSSRFAGSAYATFHAGGATFVALGNNGVRELGADRAFSSRNLVPDSDLRLVVGPGETPWTINDEHILAEWQDGRFVRVSTPQGWNCESIAGTINGLYLACVSLSELGLVHIFKREGELWSTVAARTMILESAVGDEAGAVVSVPYLGVTENEQIWASIRTAPYMPIPEPETPPEPEPTRRRGRRAEPPPEPVAPPPPRRLDGTRSIWRGVAHFSGMSGPVTYHHSRSNRELDGAESQLMPDRINALDVSLAGTPEGHAWFATLEGAVRIGNHQGVIFGEARGVPGEVVADVQVGTLGKVWMAAAEGPGFYFNREMDFRMPSEVRAARPIALAQDSAGRVYAAGPNGLMVWRDGDWTIIGEAQGLPATNLRDVEVGANDQVWLLAPGALYVLDAPTPVATTGE